jgi:hypothetical protein
LGPYFIARYSEEYLSREREQTKEKQKKKSTKEERDRGGTKQTIDSLMKKKKGKEKKGK